MRVLFSSTAGEGHFGPLSGFARAVAHAGHEVAVAAPGSFAASVAAAGLAHLPFADVPGEILGPIFASLPAMPRDDANATVMREVFGRLDTQWALPGMRAIVADWRPDVIVREPTEFASYIAAAEAGVPHVHVTIGLAAFEALAAPHLVEPLASVGAPDGLPGLWDGPRATLAPLSLEDPAAPGPADTRRYASVPPRPEPLPDRWPGDDRPLVYVSFGSVAPRVGFYPGVYRAVLDALDGIAARVLMTIGREADPGALGPLPDGVRVERWVPQADVLAHAAVVVGHGGFGTTMGALGAGVPQVVLPLFASDQFVNAGRVGAVGAGVGLAGPESIGEVRAAVERTLTEREFADRAREISAEIAAQEPLSAFPGFLAAIVG